MKIFLDCTFLRNTHTGIDVAFLSLAKQLLPLNSANNYVILIDSRYNSDYLVSQLAGCENYILKSIYSPLPLQVIYSSFFIPFYLKLKKFDVYHNPYFFGPLFNFISPKTKVVITVHDVYHRAIPHLRRKIINFIFGFFADRAIKKADAVIAISLQTKEDIIKYLNIDERKIHLIHQALNSRFESKEATGSIEKFGLSGKRYILTVGSILPSKGISDLIYAFDKLVKKYSVNDVVLVFAGMYSGNYIEEICVLIKNLGYSDDRIKLLGYVEDEDLKQLYIKSSLVAIPSHYEGFGLPILEAMNFNKPIIARNASSLKEIVSDAGLLFNDIEELACLLNTLLKDQEMQKQLILKGTNRLKDFSWVSTANKTLNLYSTKTD
ncbi:glycosyltransferase family 4 protein [Pedobacter psychrotolerans]|uniref:glycosyltransferase family 4 protein n=1 Tax=Pedobacter psychrotolerans TaxID=1843235 RepID=UPI003F9455D2